MGGRTLPIDMDPVLVELDNLLRRGSKVEKLSPVISGLLRILAESPGVPQAWQPLDEGIFDSNLPPEIVSVWLFVLRGDGQFPNERHPNSWQRSLALRGHAAFDVYREGSFRQHPLDGGGRTVQERAISIPPNVWHRISIGPEPFVSLSFHTTPAAELIEETCDGDNFSQTHRRLYKE
jgi:hypothetical protein